MVVAVAGAAEIIKRSLEAFNSRDEEGMIALQHPEIEFVPILAAMEGRVYRTPAETREFLRALKLDWEVFETHPEEFYEREDRGLALGTWHARGRGSGLELTSQPGAWFAEIRDGLVRRWRTYTERAEALAALGVGEDELPRYRVTPP
jgi:ketosteroid isomerase-like protein